MSRTRLQFAVDQIETVRRYTTYVLAGLTPDEWFWHPREFTTHVAWQVGHLACSQYSLCMRRVRGHLETDEAFLPGDFSERFKLASIPVAGKENNPSPEEIQRVFDAVHERALAELAERTDAELDVPVDPPHPVFKTKLEAVQWSSHHEMLHAGQVGLLRRLMGKPAQR